ncbi:hypothetical protein ACFYN9_40685 [Streptomyces collinus]|uniref:hypothetical protein n=1 Tax=Streptomyces collinus TaxID=42684 RepID=UPI00369F518D
MDTAIREGTPPRRRGGRKQHTGLQEHAARVIELNLYPQCVDLVAAGRKTREVRGE